MSKGLIERLFASQTVGDVTLLDAVEQVVEGVRHVTLFLRRVLILPKSKRPKRQMSLRNALSGVRLM